MKKRQIFKIKLSYQPRYLMLWVHSLSILLVWKGSETSHHLSEDRPNFWALFHDLDATTYSSTSDATPIT